MLNMNLTCWRIPTSLKVTASIQIIPTLRVQKSRLPHKSVLKSQSCLFIQAKRTLVAVRLSFLLLLPSTLIHPSILSSLLTQSSRPHRQSCQRVLRQYRLRSQDARRRSLPRNFRRQSYSSRPQVEGAGNS
jgi:hypothetical protein